MKILMVNKFLYPKGGSETYVINLGKILKENGNEVQYFGLADDRNVVDNDLNELVSPMNFGDGVLKNLSAPFRILYSFEAKRKIRKVLEYFQPDIVHFNNIQFHLTPSIIEETHRYRIQTHRAVKIIYTAHDYQLICPSHGLFDGQLNICEDCLDGNYTNCLRRKCVKNSCAKSFLGMLDGYLWKWKSAYDRIDTIICCSSFLKGKLDTQRRFAGKTVAIHNFIERQTVSGVPKEDYVLEFGHLSKDKGTLTLLEVCRRMPDVRFVFAGYGAAVAEIAKVKNAEYVGFQSGEALKKLIAAAAVSVCPSEIYENCPFSVIESQMYGTPVVGARIGGIPELVKEGETGELFEAGNADELEFKLKKMLYKPELLNQYTQNSLDAQFESPESYSEKISGVYFQ